MAERAAALEKANREAMARDAAAKEKEAAKREAVRRTAFEQADRALSEAAAQQRAAEAKKQQKAELQKDAAAKLWQRWQCAAELAGVDEHGDDLSAHMPASDHVASAASKLREIVLESRRAEALDCEKVAAKALKVTERKAAALARSEQWLEIIPVPSATAHLIHRSLVPVLHALNHGLEEDSVEMKAARSAFRSWHNTSWFDHRSNEVKPKPAKAWTVEQYALDGFAGRYALKLHVPRVAAIRQAIVWLLQCAPGLPRDAALCFADLGAGTCAACLGARLALRDLGGDEQPYRVFPIDVASSSTRFQKAFGAMTKHAKFGPAALLRGQEPLQYLTEEQPGVDCLASSLLDQLAARGERSPHVLLASFSLHYLKPEERNAFYALLASKLTRPMLLVIIKGVGEVQRPPSHVPSVFFGLHYYVGHEHKRPRVIEAHACLILPSAAPSGRAFDVEAPYDPTDGDSWVLCTFRTLQRRCDLNGFFSGTTALDPEIEKGIAGLADIERGLAGNARPTNGW
ncbi:hypothetical protein Ctob_009373 [Chrysochromulina tobinii]|uniref:Uncharacterized protein n=1 Tax=Chrysochromulina tobinii TaxID=1460289 RepID=A0A0M0JU92_9EUKA|nr:hypothetical protein Ctob_009373 [Chrysochromulina tobinii]|eukprot:KOO29693.1 hypothetical protein Ctob_009373 [Chrysochromulina sp. CCMP291]